MIIHDLRTNTYQLGRKSVLAEVQEARQNGLWTKEIRESWLKSAVSCREGIRHRYHEMQGVIAYYAGRISALKSKVSAHFSESLLDDEIAHLLSLSNCHQQERMREAVVYTDVFGWDWKEDVEDERDLIWQEMMLTPSCSKARFRLDLVDIWLCVCLIGFAFLPVVTLGSALCILIFGTSLAYQIHLWIMEDRS
jgi:hypothetical protein